ncbi:type VI secretion system amidase effector protein Tae4 [Caballeronia grimmiae]|uniref:Cytoplasmic protein n=1 Tax=Caballeronia grimmiae TaxID=1071679 RepID=A0A069P6Z9_9BURK|nr:type VI secretion system amidase effector protein Tae4 [Caballeronia grimmiae]KDR36393.1 hypothetical protein BG57_16140 [Caballeronia grimmiae]GGD56421.1 hypothetical protein GCM10010985_07670 [Caballeronia grimmiae]
MSARPPFASAWLAFLDVRVSVAGVGKLIGGRVNDNVKAGIFQNACPIRMSYVLNRTGFPVRKDAAYASVSGADGAQYLFRVNDMMAYLERQFGKPEKTVKSPREDDFRGEKGILVVRGHGWDNAQGHVTLWDGNACSDSCHLLHNPDNGTFIPETALLWKLH